MDFETARKLARYRNRVANIFSAALGSDALGGLGDVELWTLCEGYPVPGATPQQTSLVRAIAADYDAGIDALREGIDADPVAEAAKVAAEGYPFPIVWNRLNAVLAGAGQHTVALTRGTLPDAIAAVASAAAGDTMPLAVLVPRLQVF